VRAIDDTVPDTLGDFAWALTSYDDGERRIWLRLPCGHACALPINNKRGWAWDGNEDAPTLTPSIMCLTPTLLKADGKCGWHGYMTAGELRPC
jgi:hypothetical protein